MTITTKGRYSLEALLCLVSHGGRASGSFISEATEIPLGYLAQLMLPLRHAGLIGTERGAEGGYRIARKGITVKEVLAASEESLHLPCPDCGRKSICTTEAFWSKVQTTVDSVTGNHTLEELAGSLKTMTEGGGL